LKPQIAFGNDAKSYPAHTKRNSSKARTPTFQPTKCCALHEWLQWRAALQHFELVANGSKGPEVKAVS
jgi:hypothetical protein